MPDDWKTYRTRFVVRAKQLTQPFTFTDRNGHEHHGRAGDYLIESKDGLRISRREIFEDVYVAMEGSERVPGLSVVEPRTSPGPAYQAGGHVSGGHMSEAQNAGGHGFSRAESNSGIGALAPVQPLPEPANLPV